MVAAGTDGGPRQDLPGQGWWLSPEDPGPRPLESLLPPCDDPWCACVLTGGPGSEVSPAGTWNVPGVPRAPGTPAVLTGLRQALDALDSAGPLSGSRSDTAGLFELAERARALALRELAEMDSTGGHLSAGTRSTTASWLRETRLLTDQTARSTVHLAVALRDDLPAVEAVLRSGRTTVEHASAIAAGVRGLDRDTVRDAGDGLAALAQATDPCDARRRLRDHAHAVDEQLAARAERRARERAGLHLSAVGAHTAVDGTLAGEDGATVRLAMALAVEAGRVDGDQRGKAARQADVLTRWAVDYLQQQSPGASLAGDTHTVRSHLLITCTPDQLGAAALPDGARATLCQLLARAATTATSASQQPRSTQDDEQSSDEPGDDQPGRSQQGDDQPTPTPTPTVAPLLPQSPTIVGSSSPLSRGALRRLACDATLDLIVLRQPDPGQPVRVDPLYVGRSARTVTGLQFKALVVRDRTCVVRGCHRPPAQCAAHHVRHWANGGSSDLDNLVLLCHQHHHDHHDRGLDLPHRDGRQLTQTGWAQAP